MAGLDLDKLAERRSTTSAAGDPNSTTSNAGLHLHTTDWPFFQCEQPNLFSAGPGNGGWEIELCKT